MAASGQLTHWRDIIGNIIIKGGPGMWDKINWKKVGLFLGGVAFGTVGFKALFSKDAKKCYTHLTAAALRVKDYTLQRTETLRENCEDIYEDAKDINEDRKAAEEAIFEDSSATYKEVEDEEE